MNATPQFFTNERWKNRFKNNFEMINVAIQMAKEHIRAQDPRSLEQLIDELMALYPKKEEPN